jgi:hypothetical protein
MFDMKTNELRYDHTNVHKQNQLKVHLPGHVISIGKLVRKNDGHEEVGQILRTMNKYGEMKEH